MRTSPKPRTAFLLVLLFLLGTVTAQPAPIPANRLSWINAVPDGATDPTAVPLGPLTAPFRLYTRAPAGMWTGILSWVTLYNADPQDPAVQPKLDAILNKYQWLRPPTGEDQADLDTAIGAGWIVGSEGVEPATPFELLAERILHAATGGNTVRQVAFAQLLPSQVSPPYGTTYADVAPIDLLDWVEPQDDQSQRIAGAWHGGLAFVSEGDLQQAQQGQLFDAWKLARELLFLQTADLADVAAFLNDTTIVQWDELSANKIGVTLRLQGFSIVQETSASPAASSPEETPGVDVNTGPVIVTVSDLLELPLSLFGTNGPAPSTDIKHQGVSLNGLLMSPTVTAAGIVMRASGVSPFTATVNDGTTLHQVTGLYDVTGRVVFSLQGISLQPGAPLVMRSLFNTAGAMDLTTVTWTTFTVGQY